MNASQLFSRDGVKSLLETPDWAILSAENPGAVRATAEFNRRATDGLRGCLEIAGYDFVELSGRYAGIDEVSFGITGIDRPVALAYAKYFGQESVTTFYGLLFPKTVVRFRWLGVSQVSPGSESSTTCPDGSAFSLEII